MQIKCVIACFNASGEPDFFFCIVKCSESDYDVGLHYEKAEEFAKEEGYSGPMIVYDENDGPDWLFDHFVWESSSVVS